MSPKITFRCLLIVSLLSALASFAVVQFPGQVPADWKTLLEWHGDGGMIYESLSNRWLLFGVGIPLVIAFFYSVIGMFFFWRFARPVYAGLTVALLLLTPFFGISVLLPIETALAELSLLVDGAIIALSYSHPFSSYFETAERGG